MDLTAMFEAVLKSAVWKVRTESGTRLNLGRWWNSDRPIQQLVLQLTAVVATVEYYLNDLPGLVSSYGHECGSGRRWWYIPSASNK